MPPTHDGKVLRDVGLFEGLPENMVELMPEPGRFVVPQTPRALLDRYPPFYLGCRYRGASDLVAVELPRTIKACEITKGPQVQCR